MKKTLAILISAITLVSTAAFAQTHVNGYYRSNGTYVQPHYRSSPNSTVTDNYSFKGNTNPYTGSVGTNTYRNSPSSPYYTGSGSSRSSYGNSYGNSNRNSGYGSSLYGN